MKKRNIRILAAIMAALMLLSLMPITGLAIGAQRERAFKNSKDAVPESEIALPAAEGAKAPPNNKDGSRGSGSYNGLEYEWGIVWGTAADGTEISYDEDGVLMLHPTNLTLTGISLLLTFTVRSVDTNAYIPAEAVKFKIPEHIVKSWDGTLIGTLTSDIKTEPTDDSDFIMSAAPSEGYYLVYNYRAIRDSSKSFSGYVNWTFNPLDVNGGYPDDENPSTPWWQNWKNPYRDTIEAFLTMNDTELGYHKFTVDIRTRAETYTTITAFPPAAGNTAGNAVWLAWDEIWGPKPDDADDYFYIVWKVYNSRYYRNTTQPWKSAIQMLPEDNKISFVDNAGVEHVWMGEPVGITKQPTDWNAARGSGDIFESLASLAGIAGKNNTEKRLVYSQYGTYTPHRTGYVSWGGVVATPNNTSDRYNGVGWGVLMRYPKDVIYMARTIYGETALETDGFAVSGTVRMKETWDSGYERDVVKSANTRVYIKEPDPGVIEFEKWVETNSELFRTHPLGQIMLLGDIPVTIRDSSSATSAHVAGWIIDYGRVAPRTSEGQSRGQHVEIQDTGLFFTPGNYTTSWTNVKNNTEMLTDDDYELPGFKLGYWEEYRAQSVMGAVQIDPVASKVKEDYGTVYISVRTRGETDFVPYCAVVKGSSLNNIVCSWDGSTVDTDNLIPFTWGRYVFPEGTVEFRLVYDSTSYKLRLRYGVDAKLLPTEHVKNTILKHQSNTSSTAASYTNVWNGMTLKTHPLVDPNYETETVMIDHTAGSDVRYAYHQLQRPSIATSLSKASHTPDNTNPTQAEAAQQGKRLSWVVLSSSLTTRISRSDTAGTGLTDQYKLLKGTFYELLPLGTTIRPDSLRLIYTESDDSTCLLSAERYANNHKMSKPSKDQSYQTWGPEALDLESYVDPATGQTMVKISFDITDPGFTNPFQTPQFYSKVQVAFQLENPFDNINANGELTLNNVGLVLDGCGNGQYVNANNTFDKVGPYMEGRDAAFTDINDAALADGKLVLFAQNTINWPKSGVVESGFSKHVMAEETLNGLPYEDSFGPSAEVTVGNGYRYRLRYSSQVNIESYGICFYDILESGVEGQDQESAWRGLFESVDVAQIRKQKNASDLSSAYCAPVVYYSTTLTSKMEPTMSEFDTELYSDIWSTELPEDPSTVTAIAIDCRYDADGFPFVLAAGQTMQVIIKMKAPDVYRDGSAINASAFQFAHTLTDETVRQEALIGSAYVTLKDIDVGITKTSDPETGTSAEPRVVDWDGTGTIDYTLEVKNGGTTDLHNVVVEDPIPAGLTVRNILVGLNGNSPVPIADVSGISCDVDGQRLLFTIAKQEPGADKKTVIVIKTDVDALTEAGVKRYENTARITAANNVELSQPIETETMYHMAGCVDVFVRKMWVSYEVLVEIPQEVRIQLFADGQKVGEPQVLGINNIWQHTFGLLDKYRTNADGILTGEEILYTVEELPLGIPGWTVEIRENPSETGFSYTVFNVFVQATFNLQADKKLTGRPWNANDKFVFVLEDENGVELDRKVVTQKRQFAYFDMITVTDIGTYTYYIREEAGSAGGVSYDTTRHKVVVTVVTNEANGLIVESVLYDGQENLIVENVYNSTGQVVLEAQKLLENMTLEAGAFSFELADENGVIQTVTNNDDGSIVFDPIVYDRSLFVNEDGSYADKVVLVYTITEVNGGASGYTYDDKVITVTVTLTDNGEGEIIADVVYDVEATFNNRYDSTGQVVLEAQKLLENMTLEAGAFSFELADENGVIQTVTNNEDGSIVFDPIVYDRSLFVNEDGSYADKVVLVYTITEVNGGASGYTYDDKVITVTVTLTDNGEGEIIADVVYDVEATFNNTYNPLIEITVSKVWDDADDRDSIRPKSVFVNLLADGEILQTAELNADNNWTYTFTELYKFGSEGKEIVYTVKEADIPAGYTVEIVGNASDGFVITNIHKPTPDTPQTGDVSRPNWSYLMLFALVGAIAAGTALFVLKRKQR